MTPPTPAEDRRHAQRVRVPFAAEISSLINNRVDRAMAVRVEDLSTQGLRISHSDRLQVGAKYLLEIPRPGQAPLGAVFTVVRCDEHVGGGMFTAELQPQDVLDMTTRAAITRYVEPEKASNVVVYAVLVSLVAAAVTSYFLFF